MPGALVEIWQACKSGRYNHPGDHDNPAPLDPDFQYWGRRLSDADGSFRFKTILPGAYPADGSGWIRPPHVHFKVHKRGFLELTTQMYFSGRSHNRSDKILQKLKPEEQSRVIVTLEEPTGAAFDHGSKTCRFAVTIQRA